MKFFSYGKDGGYESTVSGFWFIEIKSLFSIVILKFENGSRDAYHTHAFNCFSWVLKGILLEKHKDGKQEYHGACWLPFITRKNTFHKVISLGNSYVLSFRGPWDKNWKEYLPKEDKEITLTNGRKELSS